MGATGNFLLGCIAVVLLAVLFLFLMRFALVIVIATLGFLLPVAIVLLVIGGIAAMFSSD